jgi:hypothetical protein
MTEHSTYADEIANKLRRLEVLPDNELQEIYARGINIRLENSDASLAKRILDLRTNEKQKRAAEYSYTVIRQLERTHAEILKIVRDVAALLAILTRLEKKWFPHSPLYIRVLLFIFVVILLGAVVEYVQNWLVSDIIPAGLVLLKHLFVRFLPHS